MKINGKTINRPTYEVVVIPRQSGDIVFKCGIVNDYTEFNTICPRPTPPSIVKPGGATFQNFEDKDYIEANIRWSGLKATWMVLKSLQSTEGFVLDSVDMGNPDTWANWEKEFKEAGFTEHEVALIIDTIITANGLNHKRIEEATKNFLAGQAAKLPSE